MYSSVSEAEYQVRRAKAEEDARRAYDRSDRSKPSDSNKAEAECNASVLSPSKGGLSGVFARIKDDDLLLIAILFLLFNENKDDDPLILIILAVLFLT